MNREIFFQHIDFLEEENFIDSCDVRLTEEEEVILDQGSNSTDLFVIKRGRFVVSDTRGVEFVLAALDEGDVFGEMSFFRCCTRSAKVTSIAPGELLCFSRDAYKDLFLRKPELSIRILFTLAGMLSDRLQHADATLSLLSDNSEIRERYEIRRLMKELKGSIHKLREKGTLRG